MKKSFHPSNETDEIIIQRLKLNPQDSPSLMELVDRHSGIFINMVTSYTPPTSLSLREEIITDKTYYIYQAALKYNPNKGTKFSTHLGNEAKWMCLNIYNKNKKRPEVSVEEMVVELSEDFNSPHSKKNLDFDSFLSIMDIVKNFKDQRIYEIFSMRYIEGYKNKVMPWKMVSSRLNMSIQGCINIHDSTITKLQNKLKK